MGKNMNNDEFVRLMNRARVAYIRAESIEQQIFEKLEEAFPKLHLDNYDTNAENADNIQEAISCYLQYGEYSVEEIWNEIQASNRGEASSNER
jgi:hypothetical protein